MPASTMFLPWLFVSIMGAFHSSSGERDTLHAYAPGDIIIGGLFPIHLQTNRSTTPGPISCSDYDLRMFLRTQVMIYAITEINQRPGVLPNLTLGYDIYDTCGDVSLGIRATLHLLRNQSDPQSCLLPADSHSALPEPQTKVVIGERYSEVSIAVARIVALSSVAQISYASTSELLSKKFKFPTFLRTVSSDEFQTKAIAELVMKFNWKTVAIVGSDDEYGKYGSDRLVDYFRDNKVCIEFIEILTGNFSHDSNQTNERLNNLVDNINNSSAEAIILFTKDANVNLIINKAIKFKLNRTWIASDTWSTSTTISSTEGIESAGQVFGFISKRNEVPGFKDYVMSMFNTTTNPILEDFLRRNTLCSDGNGQDNCTSTKQCLSPSCLASNIDQDESFNIYLAVQVIVEGLRSLLNCDEQRCERNAKFTALELLMEIRKVNFSINSTHISFDENGDPSLGYDILYWEMNGTTNKVHIKAIGEYWPNQKIKVLDEYVNRHNVNVTVYKCFKTCEPGQELKETDRKCCKVCGECNDGEYSSGNGEKCKSCSLKQYSSQEKDTCLNKSIEFLDWGDPFVIILSSSEVFGIIVTIVFAVPFIIYRNTPIVKAVGGYLCFLELFSLLACFCLTFSFTGTPTAFSCMVGLPLFGIAFSLCIACILANLLQILVGFSFDLKIGSWIKKLNQPLAVVTIVPGIQIALCVSWLCFQPPCVHEEILHETILLQCEKGSTKFFIAMLGYNAVLALICFLFAYKGKQLPDLYKNASLITISMLLFLVIWILFIPIYISLIGKYKRAIESTAILISSYSILGCHLAPKCYIMVFRKEINNENAITEYIRKHYEQRGMAVVKS